MPRPIVEIVELYQACTDHVATFESGKSGVDLMFRGQNHTVPSNVRFDLSCGRTTGAVNWREK